MKNKRVDNVVLSFENTLTKGQATFIRIPVKNTDEGRAIKERILAHPTIVISFEIDGTGYETKKLEDPGKQDEVIRKIGPFRIT